MAIINTSNIGVFLKINFDSYKELISLCEIIKTKEKEYINIESIIFDLKQEDLEKCNSDFLKKENELLDNISELSGKIKINSINTIVYSAMILESYIYDYSKRNLGSFTDDHIDRIDIISKFLIVFELITKKKFPKDNNIYNKICKLFRNRNSIVHNKSKSIDFKTILDYRTYVINRRDNLSNDGIEAYETVKQVFEFMKEYDPLGITLLNG